MQAIIVAGGKGERLRPITDKIPKPMVEVKGKTILEHTISLLKNNGVTDLILALCYLPEVIVEHFGNGEKFGVNIKYTFEDPKNPLGTAGAIRESKKFIRNDFIVTYADILRKLDVSEMCNQHKRMNSLATINVYKRFGKDAKSMVLFDLNDKVTMFKERPSPEEMKEDFVWSNGSFYIFDQKVFDYIGEDIPTDFGKDVFPKMIVNGEKVNVYETEDYFIDVGTLDKLEEARATFIP
jgi:NDP-sugar pyrophosphorylase family protein